jgi:hypothetical protein
MTGAERMSGRPLHPLSAVHGRQVVKTEKTIAEIAHKDAFHPNQVTERTRQ